jgi:2-polyprenyl-3-methyl-5-hydroxy-6-metoxy-1,4-benzoquinol methylase
VLEHIRDRESFLDRLSRLLKNGGKLIIAVPQERIRGDATVFQILFNAVVGRLENPHVVTLTYKEVQDLLHKAGFRITDRAYTNYFFPARSPTRKVYSWSLVMVAYKL